MTSSGTYAFQLSNSSITVEAFERAGKPVTSLTRANYISANRSLQLELQAWSLKGINLWEVMPFTIELVAGQAVYTAGSGPANISPNAVLICDAYYSTINGGGTGVNIDRVLTPVSRDQYAAYPNKLQQGIPTVYWFQRTESPSLTLWQVPLTGWPAYAVSGYYLSRIQDANIGQGETPDVPYRMLDALCAGLAARLAFKFNKPAWEACKAEALEAWNLAMNVDQEGAGNSIRPDVSSYMWR